MNGEAIQWDGALAEWLDEQATVPVEPVSDEEVTRPGLSDAGLAPRVDGTWIACPTPGWTEERARRITAELPALTEEAKR